MSSEHPSSSDSSVAAASECCHFHHHSSHHHHHQQQQQQQQERQGPSQTTGNSPKSALRRYREKLVRRVHANSALNNQQKLAQIRAIMLGRYADGEYLQESSKPASRRRILRGERSLSKDKSTKETCQKTFHNAKKGVLGCRHYARKCIMKADCCGQYVGCRLCHQVKYGRHHAIDRTKTKLVGCMNCGALDIPAGKNCEKCGVEFAKYYCEKCKFWDDAVGEKRPNGTIKSVFHCDGCGACRIGKGLGIDNMHCDKCGTCFPIAGFHKHKCVERSLDANCPICMGRLADSREEVKFFIRCGHAMHMSCYRTHITRSFTCPVCKKTFRDMDNVFRRLDKKVEDDWKNMSEEYRNKVSTVLCQDCHKKSDAKFHFIYHRCGECGSYNTRTVDLHQRSADEVERIQRSRQQFVSQDILCHKETGAPIEREAELLSSPVGTHP